MFRKTVTTKPISNVEEYIHSLPMVSILLAGFLGITIALLTLLIPWSKFK